MSAPGLALEDALRADGFELRLEGRLPVVLARDEEDARRLLVRAGRDRLRVAPAGNLSKLPAYRPEVLEGGVDLVLGLRRLEGVVEYEPGDGVLTAKAGTPWAALAARVAEGGHRLPAEAPEPHLSTLGGVLGCGLSGPDRLLRGPLRHHVLGATVLLADGTLARSGGRLVKNVTGFDLHRLYTGSRGTLCAILEASLRLVPEPEEERLLSVQAPTPQPLLEHAARLRRELPGVLSLTLCGDLDDDWSLHLSLAGRADQVEREARQALAALGDGARCCPPATLRERRAELRDRFRDGGSLPRLWVAGPPSGSAAMLRDLLEELPLGGEGRTRYLVQPGVSQVEVFTQDLDASDGSLERLRRLSARLAEHGARLEPRQLPSRAHVALAPAADADPVRRWMRALTRRFDPLGTFASPSFPCRP